MSQADREVVGGLCDRFVLALMSAVERRGVNGSLDDVIGKCVEEGLTEAG